MKGFGVSYGVSQNSRIGTGDATSCPDHRRALIEGRPADLNLYWMAEKGNVVLGLATLGSTRFGCNFGSNFTAIIGSFQFGLMVVRGICGHSKSGQGTPI
jgi:hypothetical protein